MQGRRPQPPRQGTSFGRGDVVTHGQRLLQQIGRFILRIVELAHAAILHVRVAELRRVVAVRTKAGREEW